MRFPSPLLLAALLAVVVGATGCAGTDAAETSSAPSSSSSTASSTASAPSTSAAPSSAAASDGSQRIEVQVAGGRVSGDSGRVPVALGAPVTLVITSDVADEAHVHGYDLLAELAPGRPAELSFDATIPGVFEVELHDAGTVLLTLQVQ
ncbi:hypothetical protein [Blastococcus sp. PRF04-17]|uniref:hypothetical protein n=1 Tax=Blastococcus sp. PRF04-17 TaxID=2933797 RepID=UPI001FF413CE|nr:hypothetical protein [Blastococcus sp. PRF04-17]UOY03587.1 hypothetical protein MVA48_09765 [Blastococcus sp. PRF04-17]